MPRIAHRAYDAAAAALLSCVLTSTAVHAAVHDVITHRFENGLTLHVAPEHPAPVAAVQAWIGVGAADEAPQKAGAAHLLEHMLFKGSTSYGMGELARAIEGGGGEINAWTALDHTVYHAVLGAGHLGTAIDALGDMLTAPRIDPEALEREREVVLEELRQGSDDPARAVAQSLFATAYAAHPYRRPVIGTAETVRRIGERELVDFFRSYYTADNLTLVVAGDVDPERVRRDALRRFRAMPSGRPARCTTAEPEQLAPRASCSRRPLGEAYLALGFHVPAARHPDLAALDVAAILLGQSESARLPRLLRDRDQLVTSAYANVHALRDPGLLVLSATSRGPLAVRAIGALADHARALADDLSPGELDKARIAAETAFVRQLETAQGRARSLGWHATAAGDPQFGHVYLDRIRAVRRHDVAGVLRRYLRAENASVAAILPAPGAGRGARAARAAAPAPLPASLPASLPANPDAAFQRRAELAIRRSLATPPLAAGNAPVERRVALGNGMVLLVRRDPSVPVVAMRGVWRGGQRVEDAAHAGASTLLARMLTRGCGELDAGQVADRIDHLGGALAGVAGRNSFGLTAEWLARSWQPGLDLVADCVLSPALPVSELQREARLLLEDQAAQLGSPTQVAFRLFSEALYGEHPYARDILGTPASIDRLSRAELVAFYRDRYPISGLVLAVVGDVDVDEVVAYARARFERAPKARPAPVLPPAARAPAAAEVYRYLDRAQSHLVVGFPGATLDAPDRFALEVLVAILGGQSGRLFVELREKRALAYRVSAHSVEGVDPGFVAVYLSCAPDKLDDAVAAVRAELERVRAFGVTAAELERARSYLIGSHQIAMQRRAAVANAMAYHEAYGLGWQAWTGYDAAIRAVRPEDVAAAAATYLRPDRMIVATVQPPSASPAAQKRSQTPVPRSRPAPARPPARRRPSS
ncbi:MAG TPA: pitrilysin family protein [Kofleriaceae bacterium]|nr:pitrilysin family protein [Kofleriaceae bacterium]